MFLQGVSIPACGFWYFPVVLPVVALLVQSLHGPGAVANREGCGGDILEQLLNLCDCLPGEERAVWKERSVTSVLTIVNLHQQTTQALNLHIADTVETGIILGQHTSAHGSTNLLSSGFFELLAASVTICTGQAFSSLNHTLEEGNVWRGYTSLYYQLSTVVTLVVYCIIPVARRILSDTVHASLNNNDSKSRDSLEIMKGLNSLINACCARPPSLLKCKAVQSATAALNTKEDSEYLCAILNSPPPSHSHCSHAIPVIEFAHVLLTFEELFSVNMSILDIHTEAIVNRALSRGGPGHVTSHYGGIVECLNSAIAIIK